MYISKLVVKNYKLLKDVNLDLNERINIFVGENDSGKSTILEVLSIITSGKLNGYAFERQIKANMFNDEARKEYINSLATGMPVSPPEIIIEAILQDADPQFSGTNNSLLEDACGIRVRIHFNEEYADLYNSLLSSKEIYDIPVEFYSVEIRYFNGAPVLQRFSPIKAAFIDTTRKNYAYVVDKFIADNITNFLTPQNQTDLTTAYRKSRHDFSNSEIVKQLNEDVRKNTDLDGRELTIDLKEEDVDSWKSQMSVVVDSCPFENVGFGTQNTIKMGMVLKNADEQVNVIIMEEPENNLSYTNMARLVSKVEKSEGKQVFISTHSSYIANKLDLQNLFLIRKGAPTRFNGLPEDTLSYFKKLPGYDTLRVVLAEKIILVEGPTDELIIQRAYLDKYGVLPIENGIDVIVVDSLAFKRYCDITILLNKKTVIVTDNDGNIQNNITKITGITDEEAKNARQVWEVIPEFVRFIGDDTLAGFNNAAFDSKFLERAGRHSNIIITNKQFDIMKYAKRIKKKCNLEIKGDELNNYAEYFGIKNEKAHTALSDAITTAKVYIKLRQLDEGKSSSENDGLDLEW